MAWAPDYTTADDLATYLGITDDVDDVPLALAVTTASRAVDQNANRQYGLVAAPEARTYVAEWDRRECAWIVAIDDLQTTVGLVVDGAYVLYPRNAAAKGKPWTQLYLADRPADPKAVEITARWGWTAIPDSVVQATLLQASRLFARKDSPYGIAGSPDAGSEMRLLAKVDPDVAVALRPFRRVWGAA